MTKVELEKYKNILEAKQAELSGSLRNRDEIVIEKAPDALDEVQLAGERELAIRNLDRDSNMLRQIRRALAPHRGRLLRCLPALRRRHLAQARERCAVGCVLHQMSGAGRPSRDRSRRHRRSVRQRRLIRRLPSEQVPGRTLEIRPMYFRICFQALSASPLFLPTLFVPIKESIRPAASFSRRNEKYRSPKTKSAFTSLPDVPHPGLPKLPLINPWQIQPRRTRLSRSVHPCRKSVRHIATYLITALPDRRPDCGM